MGAIAVPLVVGLAGSIVSRALAPNRSNNGSNRIDDLDVIKADYGTSIQLVLGTTRLNGLNMFWSPPIEEVKSSRRRGKGGNRNSNDEYTYFGSFACVIGESTDASPYFLKRIWLEGQLVYDVDNNIVETAPSSDSFLADYVTFYPGTSTQNPDATIESFEGVGNVPAFRFRSYIVFRDLPLKPYGNKVPKVDVEVSRLNTDDLLQRRALFTNLQLVMRELLNKAGLTETTEYEINDLIERLVGGAFKNDGTTYKDFIQELQKFYLFMSFTEIGTGKLFFVEQNYNLNPAPIELNNYGAREYGSEITELYTYKINQETELPSRIELEYRDRNKNYDPIHIAAFRDGTDFNNDLNYRTDLTFENIQAGELANRIQSQKWSQKISYTGISLLPKYIPWLMTGRLFTTALENKDRSMQISEISIGDNYIMELEAFEYEARTLDEAAIVDQNYVEVITPSTVSLDNIPVVLDIPLFGASTIDNGIYYSTKSTLPKISDNFARATTTTNVYAVAADLITEPLVHGTVSLADNPTGIPFDFTPRIVDENTASMTVTNLGTSGVLSSVTETEFKNLQQLALINGGEIIAFRDVNQVSATEFELTGVIRGLFGTEAAIVPPGQTGIDFKLLSADSEILRQEFPYTEKGQTFDYKSIPSGFSADNTNVTITEIFNNISARPYSPTNARLHRDTIADTFTFSWTRRTRKNGEWNEVNLEVPLNEAYERYEVDIFNVNLNNIVATFTVNTNELTISTTDLVAAYGGFLPGNFGIRVRQQSETFGLGAALVKSNLVVTSAV